MSSDDRNERLPSVRNNKRAKKRPDLCCDLCQSVYSRIDGLRRHMRKSHPDVYVPPDMVKLKCPECEATLNRQVLLRNHLTESHGLVLECEHHVFSSIDDFYVWKETMEKQSKCFYRRRHQYETRTGVLRKTFVCHRSGNFNSRSTGQRHYKSGKMNAWCPAEIVLRESSESVRVQHWKTHTGHTIDLKHLKLTKAVKQEIAEKMEAGVSAEKILEDLKCSAGLDAERKHLITKRDLWNIRNEFKIFSQKTLQPTDDSVSINPCVKGNGSDKKRRSKEDTHKRVVKLPKKKFQSRCADKITAPWDACCEIPPDAICQTSENSWFVTSISKGVESTYEVTRIVHPICGDSACKFCKVCVHMFHCNCSNYSINDNMCEHINACIKNFSMPNNDDQEDDGMSSIGNNDRQTEKTNHAERFKTLVDMYASVNPSDCFKSTLERVNNLLSQGLALMCADKRPLPVVVTGKNECVSSKTQNVQKSSSPVKRKITLPVRQNSSATPSVDDKKRMLEVTLITHDHTYCK